MCISSWPSRSWLWDYIIFFRLTVRRFCLIWFCVQIYDILIWPCFFLMIWSSSFDSSYSSSTVWSSPFDSSDSWPSVDLEKWGMFSFWSMWVFPAVERVPTCIIRSSLISSTTFSILPLNLKYRDNSVRLLQHNIWGIFPSIGNLMLAVKGYNLYQYPIPFSSTTLFAFWS